MKRIILIFCAVIAVSWSAMAAEPAADLKAKIEKANKKMVEAALKGDSETSLRYYTEDAISLPNYSPMLKGKEAIRGHWKQMEEAGIKFEDFEMETVQLAQHGDIVHEIGTFTATLKIPGAPESVKEAGKYLTVWQKQSDGSVKIVAETYNSDTHPMQNQQ